METPDQTPQRFTFPRFVLIWGLAFLIPFAIHLANAPATNSTYTSGVAWGKAGAQALVEVLVWITLPYLLLLLLEYLIRRAHLTAQQMRICNLLAMGVATLVLVFMILRFPV